MYFKFSNWLLGTPEAYKVLVLCTTTVFISPLKKKKKKSVIYSYIGTY